MLLTDNQQWIYDNFQQQAKVLKERAEAGDGTLSEVEFYNQKYGDYPYLLLEPDDVIAERMADVMNNSTDISEDGKLSPSTELQLSKHNELFYGLMGEVNFRQLHQKAFTPFSKIIEKYNIKGKPVGVSMFQKAGYVPTDSIIKYTAAEYAKDMVDNGSIRIAPAQYYKDAAPLDAMRDNETYRVYKMRALTEWLNGDKSVDIFGNQLDIKNGFIELFTEVPNYYMYCTCTYFSRRMPTDFNANAAVIIEDKEEFLKRLDSAAARQLPNHEYFSGDVTYYDPYNDNPNESSVGYPEMIKHFSYAYQKEHRCVWRCPENIDSETIEPVYLKLGPLNDIARAVFA